MSNVDKAALVPKLRFPEFRRRVGWTPKRLKDACEVNPTNSALPERFVYIDLESVEAGKLTARKIINRDDAPSRAQRLLKPDDVIFQIVRPYQRNNLHFKVSEDLDHVASTGYAQLRAKASADFLYQAVHVDDFVDRVIAKCTGSSYPAINSSDLADTAIALPEPEEQQKIADCLSSLDELIAAQARKVEALKTHKKGLMQQLFPREGETQPRLRFPEFRDAGGWSLTTLGKHIQLQSGYAFSSEYFGRAGQKLVTPKNFTKIGFGNFDESISKYTIEVAPQKYICKPGDLLILLTDLTPTCELLGKPLEVLEQDGNVLLNQRIAKVELVSNDVLKIFLKQFFLTEPYNEVIVETASGSTVKHSSNKVLLNMEVALPCVDEQRQIADCLSSLDTLITAAAQELEVLKTHKKGLMQQLFPSAEDVEA